MFLVLQSECGGPCSCHVCFNLQPFWGGFAFNSKPIHCFLRQCTILMVCGKPKQTWGSIIILDFNLSVGKRGFGEAMKCIEIGHHLVIWGFAETDGCASTKLASKYEEGAKELQFGPNIFSWFNPQILGLCGQSCLNRYWIVVVARLRQNIYTKKKVWTGLWGNIGPICGNHWKSVTIRLLLLFIFLSTIAASLQSIRETGEPQPTPANVLQLIFQRLSLYRWINKSINI